MLNNYIMFECACHTKNIKSILNGLAVEDFIDNEVWV